MEEAKKRGKKEDIAEVVRKKLEKIRGDQFPERGF